MFFKEKENRRSEGPYQSHQAPTASSNGSMPKRYQSVFTEGTPLTTFGVRNDDAHIRSHSVGQCLLFSIEFILLHCC